MSGAWRVRSNWRGQLVLQVGEHVPDFVRHDTSYASSIGTESPEHLRWVAARWKWKDARVEDLPCSGVFVTENTL